jgi:hypothetical protein
MVYEIRKSKFGVFFEALIVTFLIMIIGFSLGVYIESYRTNKIIDAYRNYEVEALDLKLQNYYYQIMDQSSCEMAIEQNFIFADDVYNRGLDLEVYEEASQLSDDLFIEKKRYVLLKTELWLNSILLKQKCDSPFDTMVYMYSGDPNNTIAVSQQKIISNILKSVKEKRGNSVILLPIAGDLRSDPDDTGPYLGAIELQRRIYEVDILPAIIINEKIVLTGFNTVEEIEAALDASSEKMTLN